jgi:hypothetical protein
MYVRGYLQGSENGRVVTIAALHSVILRLCNDCVLTNTPCSVRGVYYRTLMLFSR